MRSGNVVVGSVVFACSALLPLLLCGSNVLGLPQSSPLAAVSVEAQGGQIDMASTLECHRRLYSYKVQRADTAGRVCWDVVSVMSCWGRCDSNEISDWRFPYKRSFHPVCLHDDRRAVTVELRNCEEGVVAGTERYTFLEAVSCRCAVCKSSEASCEGLRYRGQRSGSLIGGGR